MHGSLVSGFFAGKSMAKHSSLDVKRTTLGTITIAERPSFTSMDSNLSPQVSRTPMFKRGCKGFQCMNPGQLANQQNRRKVYFNHTNLWSIFPFFVLSFNLFYNFKTHTHTHTERSMNALCMKQMVRLHFTHYDANAK